MPPKPKFTREEITAAALKIVSEKGLEALTSRELGAALGSSARPIFTVFKNMDELLTEIRGAAMRLFEAHVKKAEGFYPVFKQVGLQMVSFAEEEPKLFRLLFMSENTTHMTFDDMFDYMGGTAELCVDAIQHDYGLEWEAARLLFRHCWIYTYGICALIASKVCGFTDKEISDMLSREFLSTLALIKSGNSNIYSITPQKLAD